MTLARLIDANGGAPARVGSERWTVTWWTWISEAHREDEDGFLEDQTEEHSRAFPARGLAVAHARRLLAAPPMLSMGEPQIRRERFEPMPGTVVGSWEMVGEVEEIAP